ncbi:MAG: Rieske 2Fe-2S domain-containing protein [Deltaproteobacteria bacterium]|nr:Rieske 2Fe-2S domain-containing protein [Myxococcales bacterium]MDP3216309.1 Rieske 2Fe-2S domain-containing protein [Deltaproteobacteria bacterium]
MVDRRKALKVVAGITGAAAVGMAVVPAAAVVAASASPPRLPGRPDDDDGWQAIARWDDLVVGTPRQAHIVGAEVDAWSVSPDRRLGTVWLLRGGEDTASLRALSAVCPHLGCIIERSDAGFVCPCHVSDFSPVGAALRGPSPRSMDPIESRVREGRVEVRWARFRQGTAERIREEG